MTKGLKSDGYEPIPTLRKPDNTLAFKDREKAECLADSIERQCPQTSSPRNPIYVHRVEEEVRQKAALDLKDDFDLVTIDEVSLHIKNLKTRKALGLNGISNKVIKCFFSPLLALLVTIFDACLKNYYFPTVWKEIVIIGITKPEKPRDLPASYRPINLLSNLGNCMKKCSNCD